MRLSKHNEIGKCDLRARRTGGRLSFHHQPDGVLLVAQAEDVPHVLSGFSCLFVRKYIDGAV